MDLINRYNYSLNEKNRFVINNIDDLLFFVKKYILANTFLINSPYRSNTKSKFRFCDYVREKKERQIDVDGYDLDLDEVDIYHFDIVNVIEYNQLGSFSLRESLHSSFVYTFEKINK